MIRKIIALCAGAMALTAMTALPALADDDRDDRKDRDRRSSSINTSISSVFVLQGKSGESTLTIRGRDLQGRSGRDRTRVMLGGMGPLEIMDESTSKELVVRCHVDNPRFDCNDGDYKLSVAVVRPWRSRRGGTRFSVRGRAAYDLTIGAVGPAGEKGEQGAQGLPGERGLQGVAGLKGEKGDQGEPGPQGEKGVAGEKGERGADGTRGVMGPMGPEGPPGGGGGSVACPCFSAAQVFNSVFMSGECTHGPGLLNTPDKQYVVALSGENVSEQGFTPILSVNIARTEGDSIDCSANITDFNGTVVHSAFEMMIEPAEGMACLSMLKTAYECTAR